MTETKETTTATVETLTAEVRVLVVGSRQITLSVARQLDSVSLDELEIMGRVKITTDGRDETVIGRDPVGNLALAHFDPEWEPSPFVVSELYREGKPARVDIAPGAPMRWWRGAAAWVWKDDNFCPILLSSQCGSPCREESCLGIDHVDDPADVEGLAEAYQTFRKRMEEKALLLELAIGAPLIVLAGLR